MLTEPCLALASHHHTVGSLHRRAGQHEPALAAYRESEHLLAEVLRRDAAHFEARRLHARTHFHLCNVLYALHRTPEASEACRRAYTLTQQLLGERSLHFSLRTLHGEVCFWLGKFRGESGQQAEAIKAFREAASIFNQLAQKAPDEPKWRSTQGTCLHCIGNRLVEMDRFAEAVENYRQAVALRATACRGLPDGHSWHADTAGSYGRLAEVEERLGHLQEALAAYQQALVHLRPVVQREGQKSGENLRRLHSFQDGEVRLLRRLGREQEMAEALKQRDALRANR